MLVPRTWKRVPAKNAWIDGGDCYLGCIATSGSCCTTPCWVIPRKIWPQFMAIYKRSVQLIKHRRVHISYSRPIPYTLTVVFLQTRNILCSSAIMAWLQLLFHILMMVSSVVEASVAITGATGGIDGLSGQRPMRQDFSTFQNSGPAFDLYILSFKEFLEQDQAELLSYYQVAGN